VTAFDDHKKAAQAGIAERLTTIESITKNDADGLPASGVGPRFIRWKEGTTRFLAESVSPDEAKKFAAVKGVPRSLAWGEAPPPSWQKDAHAAYAFLVGLFRDIDERPGEILRTPPGTPAVDPVEELGGPPDPKKVFVVHGRNEAARRALFSFLRALKLEPLEWSEAIALTGVGAPYVGQILDKAFAKVWAVVVLLTGDDYAGLQTPFVGPSDGSDEIGPTPQARPNVLFEAGMALGRHADRTILVELEKLRPFSDVGGRHVIRLDNSPEKRKALAQRLETCGCKVVLSGDDWLKEGDFDRAIAEKSAGPRVGPPPPPPSLAGSRLSDEHVEILQRLAAINGPAIAEHVAMGLGLSEQKALYFLEALSNTGMALQTNFYTGQPTEFSLAPLGRAYLAERDLL
jgi:predicted nucleotide-binding protein